MNLLLVHGCVRLRFEAPDDGDGVDFNQPITREDLLILVIAKDSDRNTFQTKVMPSCIATRPRRQSFGEEWGPFVTSYVFCLSVETKECGDRCSHCIL